MTDAPFDVQGTEDFWAYFNVADEVYESVAAGMNQARTGEPVAAEEWRLTLADLDDLHVGMARRGAESHGLTWPPYLPEAEEYALKHRDRLDLPAAP